MKKLCNLMVLALGFGVLAAVLGVSTSGPVGAQSPGPPGGLGVNVLNTPLPVSGTVGISGNTATNPLLVRDMDNPARMPYTDALSVAIGNGSSGNTFNFAMVPSGKLLVIEFVSIQAGMPSMQRAFGQIETDATGTTQIYQIPLAFVGTFTGTDELVGGQQVRLYARGGTTPAFNFARNSTTGSAPAFAAISGYLVNCGAGTGCPIP